MNDTIERCLYDARHAVSRCVLARGHVGKCVSEAEARIRALEAAAEKVHGIIAEYWGPCMGSVESLLTLREAVGERATTWLPKVSDLPRVTSFLETPAKPDRSEIPNWEGPWCKKCGAPIVTIPGFAPGCINNCPTPAETKGEQG